MKSSSVAKLRYRFPKNVKFNFCPAFGVIFWFYQQLHCKIYVWRWCGSNLVLFILISISLTFQIKKNQISKILSVWVFVAPKCQQSFKILLLVWTLRPNKFWTKCLRCLIFAQTIVFHSYFMEETTLISIWLQGQSHSSKLFKGYIRYKTIFCNKVSPDV